MATKPTKKQTTKVIDASSAILSKDPFKLYICIKGDLPKSANQLIGYHFRTRKQNADRWKFITGSAVERNLPKEMIKDVHIKAIRHSNRFLDWDGAVTSLKPIIDALKGLVLVDDAYKFTGPWTVTQSFRSAAHGPMLELWITERIEPFDTGS